MQYVFFKSKNELRQYLELNIIGYDYHFFFLYYSAVYRQISIYQSITLFKLDSF